MTYAPYPKQVRILTGTHAGALVDLDTGSHQVGSHADADICISDWSFAPLTLVVHPDQSTSVRWGKNKLHSEVLHEFKPRSFAGVTLCVGRQRAEWPSRPELDKATRAMPRHPNLVTHAMDRLRDRRALISLGSAGVLTGVVVVMLYMSSSSTAAVPPPPTAAQIQHALQARLDAVTGGEVKVTLDGSLLMLDGVLKDEAIARKVDLAVSEMKPEIGSRLTVKPRILSLNTLSETIRAASGLSDARIDYLGGGAFVLKTSASNKRATEAAAEQVKNELSPLIKTIAVVYEEDAKQKDEWMDDSKIRSLMRMDDGTVVIEDKNGKRFIVNRAHAAESAGLTGAHTSPETGMEPRSTPAAPLSPARPSSSLPDSTPPVLGESLIAHR